MYQFLNVHHGSSVAMQVLESLIEHVGQYLCLENVKSILNWLKQNKENMRCQASKHMSETQYLSFSHIKPVLHPIVCVYTCNCHANVVKNMTVAW